MNIISGFLPQTLLISFEYCFFNDRCYRVQISCNVGCDMDMGDLVYEPPRDGPTLWEIGIPDRSAAEFYIPGPDPKFMNNLYANHPDRLALLGFPI